MDDATGESGSKTSAPSTESGVTAGGFAVLFAAGAIGILSLYPVALEQLEGVPLPPGASLPVLAAASLLTPAVLLAVAVAVGLATAPRVGFRSYLLERVVRGTPVLPRLRRDGGFAIRWGLLAGAAIILVQLGFGSVVDELAPTTDGATVAGVLATVPFRFLYGGVTEELLLRWGFMSAVAYALFVVVDRGRDSPTDRVVWAAILVSAVVFGIGHLPAVGATATFTSGTIAYVLVGNSIGGIVFGWVFWRRGLEAAMLAHASAHVVLVTGSLGLLLVA